MRTDLQRPRGFNLMLSLEERNALKDAARKARVSMCAYARAILFRHQPRQPLTIPAVRANYLPSCYLWPTPPIKAAQIVPPTPPPTSRRDTSGDVEYCA